jgi:putative addiction module killer protein
MIQVEEYLDENGHSAFGAWFDELDSQAALKVTTYLTRIETGNTSQIKSLGGGVSECRINWGPGIRIYLAWDGETLVILLGGGTKRRQSKDIDAAKAAWTEYKARKRKTK